MACPSQTSASTAEHSALRNTLASKITAAATDFSEKIGGDSCVSPATSSNPSQRGDFFALNGLPNELVSHILTFFDQEPPSYLHFNRQPTSLYTSAEETPLKHVSLLSRRFRALALPRLFTYSRLDPYKVTAFLEFLDDKNLTSHVRSVVASLQGPCSNLHPAWWARILNAVPISTFTIFCAPHVFAEIASANIVDNDAWAFNMPFQILRLRQSRRSTKSPISLTDIPSLFTARDWTDLGINEGSSLKAYTTYEYFLRRTPSLLATLHTRRSAAADTMYAGLKSFTFTAIFPFYNHVDEILKCVRKMRNLEVLKLKLCPEPESTVLTDEIEEALGHIDVNDPWNEFDTAYTLVAHTVIFLTVEGRLQELHIDDVKMEGIRDNLETSITKRLHQWWTYSGGWRVQKCRILDKTDGYSLFSYYRAKSVALANIKSAERPKIPQRRQNELSNV